MVLLRDDPQAQEEAHSVDELPADIFDIVVRQSKDEAFPDEFREYLREFDERSKRARTRTLH